MQKIGRYEIVGQVGRGAFGIVWKGRDPLIGRDAAIKVMSDTTVGDKELVDRFRREAMAAGRLQHKAIVTIFDLGEHDGLPYIAMEYVEGTDLDKYIKEKLDVSMEKKIEIVIQIAEALNYAHQKGVVHRDIKPANIRIKSDASVKIMDFGIAKMSSSDMTRTGQFMGTVNYMSPEQIKAKKIDGRSDLFALGIIFYEFVSYRKPFPGDSITAVIYKIVNEMPKPLTELDNTPHKYLEAIIFKCLEKDPTGRFQNCQELADALTQKIKVEGPPRDEKAIETEKTLNVSRKQASSGNFQAAIQLLDKILDENPEHSTAKQTRQLYQMEMLIKESQNLVGMGRYEQARDKLVEATAIPHDSPQLTERHAFAASALVKINEKIKQTKVEELFGQAVGFQKEGRFEQAISVLEEILELDRYYKKASDLLAQVKEDKKKSEIESLIKLAESMQKEGRLEEAKSQLDKALALDPYSRDIQALVQEIGNRLAGQQRQKQIEDLTFQAGAFLKKEKFDEAIETAEKLVKLEPGYQEAQLLLKRIRQAKIKADEHAALIKNIAEGKKLLEEGKFTEAKVRFLKAKDVQPDNPEVLSLIQAAEKKVPIGRVGEAKKMSPALLYGAIGLVVVVIAVVTVFVLMRKTPAELSLIEAETAVKEGKYTEALEKFSKTWDLKTDKEKKLEKKVVEDVGSLGNLLTEKGELKTAGESCLLLSKISGDPKVMDRFKVLAEKFDSAGDLKGEYWVYEKYFGDEKHKDDFDFLNSYQIFADKVAKTAGAEGEMQKQVELYDMSWKAYRKIDELNTSNYTYEKMSELRNKLSELRDVSRKVTATSRKVKELLDGAGKDFEAKSYLSAKEKYSAAKSELDTKADIAKYMGNLPGADWIQAKIQDCDTRIAQTNKELQERATKEQRVQYYVTTASSFEADGNLREALKYYKEVLTIDASNAQAQAKSSELEGKITQIAALQSQVDSLKGASDYAKAKVAAKQILAVNPKEPGIASLIDDLDKAIGRTENQQEINTLFASAEAAEKGGNFDQAIKIYGDIEQKDSADNDARREARRRKSEAVTKKHEGELKGYWDQGAALIAQKKYKESLDVLEKIRRINPGYQGLEEQRSLCLQEMHKSEIVDFRTKADKAFAAAGYGDAKKWYSEILRIDPQDKQSRERLSKIEQFELKGQAEGDIKGRISRGEYEEALKKIQNMPSDVRNAPPMSEYWKTALQGWTTQVQRLADSNLDEAEIQASRLRVFDPASPVIKKIEQMRKEKETKAGEEKQKKEEVARLLREAQELVKEESVDKLKEARKKAEQALGLDPSNTEASGIAELAQKKLKDLESGSEGEKEVVGKIRNLCQQGSYAAAASELNSLLKENPQSPGGVSLGKAVFYNASLEAFLKDDCSNAKAFAEAGVRVGDADSKRMLDTVQKSANCSSAMIKTVVKSKEKYKTCP